MSTRAIIAAIAAGLLGFLLGSLIGPLDLRLIASLRRENAALREQVRLYEKLLESYKREEPAVQNVLDSK